MLRPMSDFGKYWPATITLDSAEDPALCVAQLLPASKVAPVFSLFCLITSALIVTVMWNFTRPPILLSWGATITFISGPGTAVLVAWRNRNKDKPTSVVPEIIARIIRQVTILGLIWGARMACLYPAEAPPQ